MPSARLPAAVIALLFALLAPPAADATHVGFDDLASPSDVAIASLPGVSVSTALVLDEADLETLTGIPAAGTFATSGTNGLLNTYAPDIVFTFSVPVTSFSIDVLSISNDGVTLPVLLEAFQGATLEAATTSTISNVGDSGYHEETLFIAGLFTEIRLSTDGVSTSSFWLDSATFTPVPEPGTAALAAAGLALLSGMARGMGRRA